MKMRFSKKLITDEKLQSRKEAVRWKLSHGAGQLSVYCLVLVPQRACLEIMHNMNFRQPFYEENPPYIVGFASGKKAAEELALKITQEALKITGKADPAAYLMMREGLQ